MVVASTEREQIAIADFEIHTKTDIPAVSLSTS